MNNRGSVSPLGAGLIVTFWGVSPRKGGRTEENARGGLEKRVGKQRRKPILTRRGEKREKEAVRRA